MLEWIKIIYFQAHKKSILNFSSGLNVIIGSTHKGKSSIMRSIRWLFDNKPRGDGFRSHFTKKATRVSGQFKDTPIITRSRGKKNIYKIGDQKPLKAIGVEVPEEVKKITNIDPVNIQSQGDKYFMLQQSPGQRAKDINEIVGLTIIDKALTNITSKINTLNSNAAFLESEIESEEEKKSKYENLDRHEKRIKSIRKSLVSKKTLSNRIAGLNEIIDTVQIKEEKIKTITEWLEIEGEVKSITGLIKQMNKIKNTIIDLKDLKLKVDKEKSTQNELDQVIEAEKPLKGLQNDLMMLSNLTNTALSIKNMISDIKKASEATKTADIKLDKLYKKRNKIAICPTCGSNLKK